MMTEGTEVCKPSRLCMVVAAESVVLGVEQAWAGGSEDVGGKVTGGTQCENQFVATMNFTQQRVLGHCEADSQGHGNGRAG
jgi:hypothetical protein